jgi:uncharacterized protein (UPF0335 family)
MSAEGHIPAADQLKSIVQRVERLETEIKDLNDDKSEIYKEARANGFDVKAIKKVVQKRKLDDADREEADQVFDTYWNAVHGINLVHARTRENIEEFDPISGEFLDDNSPASHGEKAVRPTSAGHVGEESPAVNQPETATEKGASAEVDGVTKTSLDSGTEPSILYGEDTRSDANTGGGHVDVQDFAATHQAGPDLVSKARPATSDVTYESDPPMPMKRSDFAHCFPELSKARYDAVGASIAFKGVLEPILRKGDVILDGWARYNIARSLGITYPVEEYHGSDVLLDVIGLQRAARDFTPAQERKIAAELAKETPHRADDIMAAFQIEHEREPA